MSRAAVLNQSLDAEARPDSLEVLGTRRQVCKALCCTSHFVCCFPVYSPTGPLSMLTCLVLSPHLGLGVESWVCGTSLPQPPDDENPGFSSDCSLSPSSLSRIPSSLSCRWEQEYPCAWRGGQKVVREHTICPVTMQSKQGRSDTVLSSKGKKVGGKLSSHLEIVRGLTG